MIFWGYGSCVQKIHDKNLKEPKTEAELITLLMLISKNDCDKHTQQHTEALFKSNLLKYKEGYSIDFNFNNKLL